VIRRAIRGGSFYNTAANLRAAYCNDSSPGYRSYYVGLRVALDIPKEKGREK